MRNIIINFSLPAIIFLSANNMYSVEKENTSSKHDVVDSPFGLTESEYNRQYYRVCKV